MAGTLYMLALLATLAVLADAIASRETYCGLKSCSGKGQHTICRYPFLQTNNNQCGKIQSSRLTQAEIAELVNVHNRLRNRVASGQETRGIGGGQPAATNLGPLTWNQELADIAQTWADQCNYGHDQCRDSADPNINQVGQNVAYMGNSGSYSATLTQLVTMWYDEVDKFNRNGINSYNFDPNTGHYTQLVWAETKYLGCGLVRYNSDGQWYKTYLVCNYGPSGNFGGRPIYKTR